MSALPSKIDDNSAPSVRAPEFQCIVDLETAQVWAIVGHFDHDIGGGRVWNRISARKAKSLRSQASHSYSIKLSISSTN